MSLVHTSASRMSVCFALSSVVVFASSRHSSAERRSRSVRLQLIVRPHAYVTTYAPVNQSRVLRDLRAFPCGCVGVFAGLLQTGDRFGVRITVMVGNSGGQPPAWVAPA